MYLLNDDNIFPNPSAADTDGLLAIGGDLSTDRLIAAYGSGIFPWFNDNEPLLWWSPNPRMVLFPKDLRISKSMKTILKRNEFQITFNKAFNEVIHYCANIKREGQPDTWITDDMSEAYIKLHELGIATSVEVWKNNELVGGLYGIDLKDKKVFCGESMFSKISNTSKVAFITLVMHLKTLDYKLIDCQMHTSHLESLGANEIPREDFIKYLK